MPNLTLVISEELQKKMKRHPELRWSAIAREAIEKRIEDLETMDKIASKSKLTQKDVDEIAKKINREVFEELNKRWKK